MSSKEYMIDSLTRHQVYLQRYSSSQVKKMLPFLSKMEKEVSAKLLAGGLTEFQTARLSVIQNDITRIINSNISAMGESLTTDMIDLGSYEAQFSQNLLDNIVSADTVGLNLDQVSSVVNKSKMSLVSGKKVQKMTMGQAIDQLAGSTSRSARHAIQSGVAQGHTTKRISDDLSRIFKGRTRAQQEAVIRTAANHAGAQARNKLYKENSDILDGEEYVSVLDSHTSLVCAGYDGDIFPVGKGAIPPLHFNCRSIRIPVVNSAFVVGDTDGGRPSRGANGSEILSGQSTFGGWLRKQPAGFQDDYFRQFPNGLDRAKLFRNGGLSIGKFTDKKNILISLDELKKLEPKAFERAGFTKTAISPTKPKPKPKPAKTKSIFTDSTTKTWNGDAFDDSPKWVQDKVVKYEDVRVLSENKGAYASGGLKINMGKLDPKLKKTQNTWRHEMGHIIDVRVGKEQGSYYYSSTPEFVAASKLDAERLKIRGGRGRSKKKIKLAQEEQVLAYSNIDDTVPTLTGLKKEKYLKGLASDAGINFDEFEVFLRESTEILDDFKAVKDITNETASRIARIIEAYRLSDANMFATQVARMDLGGKIGNAGYKVDGTIGSFTDLVGSATRNQVTSWNRGFSGHSDGYYKSASFMSYTESFANLTALSGHKVPFWWKIAKQFTPQMAADFERIMKYEY